MAVLINANKKIIVENCKVKVRQKCLAFSYAQNAMIFCVTIRQYKPVVYIDSLSLILKTNSPNSATSAPAERQNITETNLK